MDELKVEVIQNPGTISWNYEDLKATLVTKLQIYKDTVYSDESIKAAQADVAMLRKLRSSVESRRKEIKNRCLEPYDLIERQAKELVALIDQPIQLIDGQIKDYEARRKKDIRANILSYIADTFSDAPKTILDRTPTILYDSRWENKTSKESEWRNFIAEAHSRIMQELRILAGLDADYRQEAYSVYTRSFNLTEAMNKADEMKRQKELLMERQRQREEAERLRKEQEEKQKQEKALSGVQDTHDALSAGAQPTEERQPDPIEAKIMQQERIDAAPQEKEDTTTVIKLYGATPQQIEKIISYIDFIGVKSEVTKR